MTHTHPEAIEYAAAEAELQSMATGPQTAHGAGVTPSVTDAASGDPKAAPTAGGVTVPGVSTIDCCRCGEIFRRQLMGTLICGACGRTP